MILVKDIEKKEKTAIFIESLLATYQSIQAFIGRFISFSYFCSEFTLLLYHICVYQEANLHIFPFFL